MNMKKLTLTALLALATLANSAYAQMPSSGSPSSEPASSSTGFDPPTQAPANMPSVNTPTDATSANGVLGAAGQTPTATSLSTVPGGIPHATHPLVFTTDHAVLYPPIRDFRLSAGDSVLVRVFGEAEYIVGGRIDMHGDLLMPFLRTVTLSGLTVPEAQEYIASKLISAGIYRDPEVSVTVTDAPKAVATVVGEVNKVIAIYGQKRLIDVLYGAGTPPNVGAPGFPVSASHVITIERPGVPEPIVIDLGDNPADSPFANIPVFAGDTVILTRAGIVYVVGSFKTPGVYPLSGNNPTTMIELAAVTGGPTLEAKYGDLRLIRTVGDHRTVVQLDIKKILDGKAPDPILQGGDILFLPQSTWKTILSTPAAGTILGLVSLALSALNTVRYN